MTDPNMSYLAPDDVISPEEVDLIQRLYAQLQERAPRNKKRLAFYEAKNSLPRMADTIPPAYHRMGLVLGWPAKAVDIPARRCAPEEVVWPSGDLKRLRAAEVLTENNFYAELTQACVSSMIYGVSFLIVTEGGEGEPRALFHAKDAMNATGDWNPRTRRMDNLLSVTAVGKKGAPMGLALYLDGKTLTADFVDGEWVTGAQEHDWGLPVERLAYRPRVDRPMGQSRISRAVMSLSEQALRTVVRMSAHMDLYSVPEFWVLGADSSVFGNKSAMQARMDRMKAIPDADDADDPSLARVDVKQFAASDPSPHLRALQQLASLFAGETSIPLTSLGVSDMANPTSADSYMASREDLVAEVEGAIRDWSGPARRTVVRLLQVANGKTDTPASWADIDLKWRSPIYQSKASVADAGMKTIAAAPWLAQTEVGLELLGLTPQQISRALAEKATSTEAPALDPAQLGSQAPLPQETPAP